MPKFLSLLLLATTFLAACTDPKVPHADVPPEEMKAILKEMYIAEAGSALLFNNPAMRDSAARGYYFDILRRHHLTPEAFEASFAEYKEHPEFFKKMTEEILQEISIDQEQARNPGVNLRSGEVPHRPGQ